MGPSIRRVSGAGWEVLGQVPALLGACSETSPRPKLGPVRTLAESITSAREARVPRPWPLTQAAQRCPQPTAGVAALPRAPASVQGHWASSWGGSHYPHLLEGGCLWPSSQAPVSVQHRRRFRNTGRPLLLLTKSLPGHPALPKAASGW